MMKPRHFASFFFNLRPSRLPQPTLFQRRRAGTVTGCLYSVHVTVQSVTVVAYPVAVDEKIRYFCPHYCQWTVPWHVRFRGGGGGGGGEEEVEGNPPQAHQPEAEPGGHMHIETQLSRWPRQEVEIDSMYFLKCLERLRGLASTWVFCALASPDTGPHHIVVGVRPRNYQL